MEGGLRGGGLFYIATCKGVEGQEFHVVHVSIDRLGWSHQILKEALLSMCNGATGLLGMFDVLRLDSSWGRYARVEREKISSEEEGQCLLS